MKGSWIERFINEIKTTTQQQLVERTRVDRRRFRSSERELEREREKTGESERQKERETGLGTNWPRGWTWW